MTPLKVISLNIELDRHLDQVLPFLQAEQPDVILLQEVLEKDRLRIEKAAGMTGPYLKLNALYDNTGESPIGLLTLSILPILSETVIFYRGSNDPLVRMNETEPEKMSRALLVTEVIKDHQHYRFINTHFTWSPHALPNDAQYHDLSILLTHLHTYPDLIFCGDFNAPRGTAIFDALAACYHDNIPQQVTTTIDKNLHKAGDLSIVVDGFFTTPDYQVMHLEVVDGLSDHCALLATLVRKVPLTLRDSE